MEIALSLARLRPWHWDDAESLVKHANNRNVSRNLVDAFPFPYTEGDAAVWLEQNVDREPVTNFVIDVDGEAAAA